MAEFTGKHLCQSLFFNKVEKKRLQRRYFPMDFAEFLRSTFFIEQLLWLFLVSRAHIVINILFVVSRPDKLQVQASTKAGEKQTDI